MTTPIHFFTKASDAWACPRKYFWRYKEEIVPKERNSNLERGSYCHAVIHRGIKLQAIPEMREAAIGQALLEEKDKFVLTPEIRDDANRMLMGIWEKLQGFKVLETEKVLNFEPPSGGFVWRSKLDAVILDPMTSGLWQGEYKTTKSYTAKLKVLYHQGIQPFIYLLLAKLNGFQLQGTKMFISSTKECVVEDVEALKEHYAMAQRFIDESADYIAFLDKVGAFPQNRTACITLTSECPYRPLCHPHAREEYYKEVREMMFRHDDPLAHLEET